MVKSDIKQVNYISRRFNVNRNDLSDLIHKVKKDFEGNPNLKFNNQGDIYSGNEYLGNVKDA